MNNSENAPVPHADEHMSKADKVVALVNEMRNNGEDMRLWKNVEISRRCMDIMKSIDDEPMLAKARACEAIIDQLPEFNVPRYTWKSPSQMNPRVMFD